MNDTRETAAALWQCKFDEATKKISRCHDLMDKAGVVTAEGTHPQLVPRLEMLIAERDKLRAELAALRAGIAALIPEVKS